MNEGHTDTVTHEAQGLIGLPPAVALRSIDLVRTYDLIRDTLGRKVLAQRFKNLFPGHSVADIETGQVKFNQTFQFQAE